MKIVLKNIMKILLFVIIISLLFIIINFIVHKVKSKNEYNYLNEIGYINKYNAGEYELNIYRVGNSESKHKIIALSGLGINDYSVEMSFVNDELKEDYEIIYIDRAGYGYSDNTSIKQTVEQVVSDYRNALNSAGIEGPYILLPHSYGGVFATYWESIYPEEIEGVIFVDTSELGLNVWDEEEYNISFVNHLELFASKLGLHRLVLGNYFYPLPKYYSKENQKIVDYLNIYSITNKAKLSEIEEMNNNTNKTYNSIVTNDIPKIYISSSSGFRTINEFQEYINWINDRQEELGEDKIKMPSDEIIETYIDEFIKWEEEKIIPYINLLGNTELILLPGNHLIFQEKPEELSKIIRDFIVSLD